jgi:hypothetical protein
VLVHSINTQLEFRLVKSSTSLQAQGESSSSDNDVGGPVERNLDTDDTFSETATAVEETSQNDDEARLNIETSSPSSFAIDPRTVQLATKARLSPGWNERGEDSYTFEYRHEQSGLRFIVRVGRMGSRVNVSGMAEVSTRCTDIHSSPSSDTNTLSSHKLVSSFPVANPRNHAQRTENLTNSRPYSPNSSIWNSHLGLEPTSLAPPVLMGYRADSLPQPSTSARCWERAEKRESVND